MQAYAYIAVQGVGGARGPEGSGSPPPPSSGEESPQTGTEVRKIRNEENNGTEFGHRMSEPLNSAVCRVFDERISIGGNKYGNQY